MDREQGDSPTIPVIARRPIADDEPEYREMMRYESGLADREAKEVAGRHEDAWLNVLEEREPGVPPALDYAFNTPALAGLIHGRVIDLGAGTCWVTAKLSALDRVDQVVALDMSERFLTNVGPRIIRHHGGVAGKIAFAIGSFNRVPFPEASFDCAWLVASRAASSV